MSPHDSGGPMMVVATQAVKAAPARTSSIMGFTLYRSIELKTAFVIGLGGLLGLGVWFIAPFANLQLLGVFIGLGAAVGWSFTTYSPLEGESLGTWSLLQFQRTLRKVTSDVDDTVAVGTALLARRPVGRVRIMPGAVAVATGSYDERGVMYSPENQNIPAGYRLLGNRLVDERAVTKVAPGNPLAQPGTPSLKDASNGTPT